uniref:Uncharacterized protein n=1 Tax=Hyaloperonospora arabidopsidis (strain Emoy2) TaxID=559515 RepID=M4B1F3_HYAAE
MNAKLLIKTRAVQGFERDGSSYFLVLPDCTSLLAATNSLLDWGRFGLSNHFR